MVSPFLDLGRWQLIFLLDSIYVLGFTSRGFILVVLWCVLLYLLTKSSNLTIYTFVILKSYTYKFYLFNFLINLPAATDFPPLCVEYHFF